MKKPGDYTGQKYGRLTFIERTNERNTHGYVWRLMCDCGTEIKRPLCSVTSGNIKSCGCLRGVSLLKDVTGEKVNQLTFVARDYEATRKYKRTMWRVRCDCGNEIIADRSNVFYGIKKSCGCVPLSGAGRPWKQHKSGDKYGRLTLVEKTAQKGKGSQANCRLWRAKCDCGNERLVVPSEVSRGRVRSCGCLLKDNGKRDVGN